MKELFNYIAQLLNENAGNRLTQTQITGILFHIDQAIQKLEATAPKDKED